MTFKNYKKEQKYYRELAKKQTLSYDSGKIIHNGKVIQKGTPLVLHKKEVK